MLELNFNPFPELETERLKLERVATVHAEAMFEMRSNDDVMRYIERPRPKSIEDIHVLIRRNNEFIDANEALILFLRVKDTDKFCGNILLWQINKDNHRGEVGYLLHPDYWRKGIVTEAVQEVLRYGFDELKLHSIEANVNPKNEPSWKLLEKCGFVREAYFRENFYWEGKFHDTMIYSLLVQDWKKSRL